jgi:Flp pilus assembly protein TadD
MTSPRRSRAFHSIRPFAAILLAAALGVALASCKTAQTTGSVGVSATAGDEAIRRRSAQAWGERSSANLTDAEAAVRHAQALRANGLHAQAVAVLERAAMENPKHRGVLGAYGRALADIGHYKRALDVLARAHPPGEPDWRILSVQGAALDQLGRHDEAQRYYGTALRLMPDEPSVLSNLGLSYALCKDLVRAEATLRRAAGRSPVDSRVRRNLALVVGLQGRSSEEENIAPADMPASDTAAADFAYLRQVLAQQNGWRQPDQRGRPAAKAAGS